MAAKISRLYAVVDGVKELVMETSKAEDISEELIWLLLRQRSDFEMLLCKEAALEAEG